MFVALAFKPVIIYLVEPCTIDVKEPTQQQREGDDWLICVRCGVNVHAIYVTMRSCSAKTPLTKTGYIFSLPMEQHTVPSDTIDRCILTHACIWVPVT